MGKLSDKEKENALNEVRILASIEHKNICQYREAFVDEASQSLWQVSDLNFSIIMEYADNGDLFQKICTHQKGSTYFKEEDIWKIFINVVRGLRALHELRIFHRDLKSANVFLNKDSTAKLGDMNVSKVAKKGLLYTQTGTPYYASPEVWRDQPYDSKSDIWSLGCVLYESITLKPPFRAEDMQGLYKKVLRGIYPKIPQQFSVDLANVVKQLIQVSPQLRPSCEKILEMPAVKKRIEKYFPQEEWVDKQSILLSTIRVPKNLLYLTDRLPKAKYGESGNGWVNERTRKMEEEEHMRRKTHDAQGMLPEIKSKKSMKKNVEKSPSYRDNENKEEITEESSVRRANSKEDPIVSQKVVKQLSNSTNREQKQELSTAEETKENSKVITKPKPNKPKQLVKAEDNYEDDFERDDMKPTPSPHPKHDSDVHDSPNTNQSSPIVKRTPGKDSPSNSMPPVKKAFNPVQVYAKPKEKELSGTSSKKNLNEVAKSESRNGSQNVEKSYQLSRVGPPQLKKIEKDLIMRRYKANNADQIQRVQMIYGAGSGGSHLYSNSNSVGPPSNHHNLSPYIHGNNIGSGMPSIVGKKKFVVPQRDDHGLRLPRIQSLGKYGQGSDLSQLGINGTSATKVLPPVAGHGYGAPPKVSQYNQYVLRPSRVKNGYKAHGSSVGASDKVHIHSHGYSLHNLSGSENSANYLMNMYGPQTEQKQKMINVIKKNKMAVSGENNQVTPPPRGGKKYSPDSDF